MPTGEILVIAAAAAVFIIINIIMWRDKKKKERKAAGAAAADSGRGISLPGSVPESAAAAGFRLLENTVIVHTDDRL